MTDTSRHIDTTTTPRFIEAPAIYRKSQRLRRMLAVIGVILLLFVLYYGIHILLRTQALMPYQIIAHRGGPQAVPENTLAAFRQCIAHGIHWIEFDVQMTRDGELVVMHDETVDRTTNGTGAVGQLTLEQIQAFDTGNGERIPTLREVVMLAKQNNAVILSEVKSPDLYPGIEAKLLQILAEADYLDRTIIQSFDAQSLETLHRLDPDVKLCALFGVWQFDIDSPPGEAQFVAPMAEMALISPDMIRQAHREGRRVLIWYGVTDHTFTHRIMRFFGADGVMSDKPFTRQ